MHLTRSLFVLGVVLFVPLGAFAHEHQVFEINGASYEITIGSLNEPVSVDDKSGVDFRVAKRIGATEKTEPVTGLESSLNVELGAGDKKKVLSFSPVYGVPGSYKASFYPTVATTYSYRVFGSLENTPFDVTFTCSPAGHAQATDDTTRVEVSPGVFRVLKSGSYGCPAEKSTQGFPEETTSLLSLKETGEDSMVAYGAAITALLALGVALVRRS